MMESHKLSEQSIITTVEALFQQGHRLSIQQKFPILNQYCSHAVFPIAVLIFFRSSKYFTWPWLSHAQSAFYLEMVSPNSVRIVVLEYVWFDSRLYTSITEAQNIYAINTMQYVQGENGRLVIYGDW
jgi:hypothetical protein